MDTQKIEPLLMDYALGATTPEVAALIEAYQDKDAEVRARLEQWRGVANLARQAMEEREPTTMPIFPRRQLQSARRTTQWRRAAIWSAALAACLMLGYVVGTQGHNRTVPVATSSNLPVAAVEDFWSTSRLRAVAERDAARSVRSPASSLRNPSVLLQQFGG